MEEEEEKTSPEKQSASLYGPTQLVGLLEKTATKVEAINASVGDLFGDDNEDVFRDIEEDQFKKPQELDGSKSSSRLSPAAKCSPKESLTRCDADAEVPPVVQDASGLDESSLCLKRGKRKLISSDESGTADESSERLNDESCDSPLLVVQKRRRKKKRSAFIDDEAALSEDGDGVSGDEDDGDHMDALEASFVDDATQGEDNATMYLKSIKSPAAASGRGRRPLRPITADLFSQVQVLS